MDVNDGGVTPNEIVVGWFEEGKWENSGSSRRARRRTAEAVGDEFKKGNSRDGVTVG